MLSMFNWQEQEDMYSDVPSLPVANTSLSRPFWKQRSTRLFQAGRQPAWWEATPRRKAGTSFSRTASGLSALHSNNHMQHTQAGSTQGPAC